MIGRLKGTLIGKQAPVLLVDVNGVGYELEAPMSTFYQLPPLNQTVVLHTHMVVREDAHLLYGFASEEERALFRALIRVNGVGAKLALTVLSGISVDDFVRCVHDNDAATLVRLPGVGKKTAERLIIEMRDRFKDWQTAPAPGVSAMVMPVSHSIGDPLREAIAALVALGYKPQEASRLVQGVGAEGKTSEEIIRHALRAAVR